MVDACRRHAGGGDTVGVQKGLVEQRRILRGRVIPLAISFTHIPCWKKITIPDKTVRYWLFSALLFNLSPCEELLAG